MNTVHILFRSNISEYKFRDYFNMPKDTTQSEVGYLQPRWYQFLTQILAILLRIPTYPTPTFVLQI